MVADQIENVIIIGSGAAGDTAAVYMARAELTPLVWTGDSALNPLMILFLNNRQLVRSGLDETVHPGDQLEIIPAIEGG